MTTDPLIGSEVGRYRIAREIGEGGMGRVYEATQAESGGLVAIKVLAERYARDVSLIERFFAEARAANLIAHENIVKVHDLALLADGRPYIVMERLVGRTLRKLLDEDPPPLGGILHVMLEVLSALAAAHAVGIIHRDIKPDNIFVTERGHTKVLDFGIAKLTGANAIARTQTGVVLGTPEYMAPEHIADGTADTRGDLYSCGVVLFEALAGRRPFTGATDFALMRAHVSTPPPRVRSLRPDLPAALDDLIDRALAKRPADRFSSATSMANALRHVAAKISIEEWRPIVPGGRLMSPRPPSDLPPLEPTRPQRAPTQVTVADRPRPQAKPSQAKPRKPRVWIVVAGALVSAGVAGAVIANRGAATPEPAIATITIDEPVPVLPTSTSSPTNEMPPPGTVTAGRTHAPGPPIPRAGETPAAPAPAPSTPSISRLHDFDWRAYLAVAQSVATGRAADARLTGITLGGIHPDGRLNLAAGGTATYRFGSKTLPAATCEIRLTLSRTGLSIGQGEGACANGIVEPRCTSLQLRDRVRVVKAAASQWMAEMTLGPGGWKVFVGSDLSTPLKINDNCTATDPAPPGGRVDQRRIDRPLTTAERDAPKLPELVAGTGIMARELELDAVLIGLSVDWRGAGRAWDLTTSYAAKSGCLLVVTKQGQGHMSATRMPECPTEAVPIAKLPVCSPEQISERRAEGSRFTWLGKRWRIHIFKPRRAHQPTFETTIPAEDDC